MTAQILRGINNAYSDFTEKVTSAQLVIDEIAPLKEIRVKNNSLLKV